MGFGEFYINKEGKPEKADYIHHVKKTSQGTLEIAFTDPTYAPDVLEIAVWNPSLPTPKWEDAFRASKGEQFKLATDDPRRDDVWTGKDRAWFVYQIIEEIDPANQRDSHVSVGTTPADKSEHLEIARKVARQLTPPVEDDDLEKALLSYVERLLADYPPGVAPPDARKDIMQKLIELTRERLTGSPS